MREVLLEGTEIVCRYGTLEVVHGVSIEVCAGEVVTLIGPNGAGKSTLIRTLAGLQMPASGRIRLLQRDVTAMGAPARVELGLALIPEGRGVLPGLSVEDNLRMGAYVRRREAWVAEQLGAVLELFPILAQRRQQAAGTLSGGEQQMLVIGRALMSDPKVILLDEPSLGLAPMVVEEIFSVIHRLKDEQKLTVLLVEQNAALALDIADHGYVLENGRIVLEGPAASLRQNSDIKEFYLGLNEAGTRKSYRDGKHYRRRKRWLS